MAFAALVSLILVFAHTASITRLRDRQLALELVIDNLPPRYQENALPRLVAKTFDDGGWGFRVVLAAPMLVAIGSALAIQLTGN